MGAVGGLLGTAGGAGGTGFSIQSPVSTEQANTAYNGVQNSLQGQQQLLTALQAQNGLANQSNVYNQLQGVVNGTGPNPAQAMLNQATGQNVSNQAALMAGQRGASANPALIARLAAQQGGALQQQAVGQGATMQAQQSLNALGAAGNLATTQAGQQIGQVNQNVTSQQGEQSNLLNSIAGQNQANAGLAAAQMGNTGKLIGGVSNGLGSGISSWLGGESKAEGGEVGPRSMLAKACMANGGKVPIIVSPGETYLSPQAIQQVKSGANPLSVGKSIPGKASVGGAKNSYANDTVPMSAEAGGIVVPRSATKAKNPEKSSKEFVDATLAKRKKKA